jgi:hypothetical protein
VVVVACRCLPPLATLRSPPLSTLRSKVDPSRHVGRSGAAIITLGPDAVSTSITRVELKLLTRSRSHRVTRAPPAHLQLTLAHRQSRSMRRKERKGRGRVNGAMVPELVCTGVLFDGDPTQLSDRIE